jgi:hypothetical protein
MKRASCRVKSLGLLRGRRRMLLAVAPVIVGLGAASMISQTSSTQAVQAPLFEVDAQWPKPLPNHWLVGSVLGLAVDARDHVFVIMDTANFVPRTETGAGMIVGRGARHPITPAGECCSAAPNVLEFDADGNLVRSWKPGTGSFAWPTLNHGISIDRQGNVWLGGAGQNDSHIRSSALTAVSSPSTAPRQRRKAVRARRTSGEQPRLLSIPRTRTRRSSRTVT